MTNLIHNGFILQYVYCNPLHVSSIVCSSSGGLNCTDAASGIVTAPNYILVILDNSLVFRVTIPDAASIQFKPPDDEHIMPETCRGL